MESFQRTLYNRRARLRPPVPKTAEDLKDLDSAEGVTFSQEKFLILNTAGEESDDLILGFASPAQLEVMRSSPSWYCDGTDHPVSRLKLFSQLFVILADTETLSVPVGFFLTSNTSETTYRQDWQKKKNR